MNPVNNYALLCVVLTHRLHQNRFKFVVLMLQNTKKGINNLQVTFYKKNEKDV